MPSVAGTSAGGLASAGSSATVGGAPSQSEAPVSTGGLSSDGGAGTAGEQNAGGEQSEAGGAMATGGSTAGAGPGGEQSQAGGATPAGGAAPAGGTAPSGGATAAGGAAPAAGSSGVGGETSSGGSGSQGSCTRDSLQAAADSLAEALTAGDPMKMALDPNATYVENAKMSDFTQGVWQSALNIGFQRDFLDVDTCETFSEIIVTEGHPYVIGARLTLSGGMVSEVTALVSDEDDWTFDADNYLKVSSAEDWTVIPDNQRDTRDTLIAAGNAYFDLFNDKSVMVPWNTPCTRLEGGQFTTGNTCDVGVPDGITFADKHWVVDRDLGTAIGMVRFGGANGLPDSHMFRCLEGKIRYVHTITICDGGC